MSQFGVLYVVATPIGNLGDISQRACQILSQVEVVAAEDTRHSQRLMQHIGASPRMLSLHDHNESQRAEYLISLLQAGESVALISDAGTPLISDPGFGLVNQCRDAGVEVVPIPGACAAITALCASGLATDRFVFEGFLPVKQQARKQTIEQLASATATSIFYESPRRVRETVEMMGDILGHQHRLVIAKELTKAFETFVSGSVEEVLTWLDQDPVHQKGEFVLMVEGVKHNSSDIPAEALTLLQLLQAELPLKKAAAIVANHYGLKKNQLYQIGLTQSS